MKKKIKKHISHLSKSKNTTKFHDNFTAFMLLVEMDLRIFYFILFLTYNVPIS